MRHRFLNKFIFFAFGLSGASALIYEIIWTRSLSTVMGASTYALSTMLAAFMAGLSLGGWIGSRLSTRYKNMAIVFAMCELGIAITGLLTVPLIKGLMPLYIMVYYSFHLSFNAFSFVQFIVNFLIMGIPTTLMGITFPVVIKYFATQGRDVGRESGRLYSMNTFGAIAGSLAGGFFLIPTLGLMGASHVAATMNLIGAFVILGLSKQHRKVLAAASLIAFFSLAHIVLDVPKVSHFSYNIAHRYSSFELASRINKYITSMDENSILMYYDEGMEGTVSVVRSMDPRDKTSLTLINNGKLEAGGGQGFSLLGYLPYFSRPENSPEPLVLSIGLGSGVTVSKLAQLPVQSIDSVEISSGVLEANKWFLSPDLFDNPRVNHISADGRNYLMLSRKTYDMIVVSPSWAVEMASAGMLTTEFFRLASQRLHSGGVLALWADRFLESNAELDIILRTMRQSFQHVRLWDVEGGLVATASNSAPLREARAVAYDIAQMDRKLEGRFIVALDEQGVQSIPDGIINSDNRPVIEFTNARNIILGPRAVHKGL